MGNVPELGAWNHNQAVQLTQENSSSNSPILFDSNSSGESGDIYEDANASGENAFSEPEE